MKYIKTFEDQELEYKIGDYILLIDNDWSIMRECVIADIDIGYGYQIEAYYETENAAYFYWIAFEEIQRKLTIEEIEDFKLRIESKKYNL